MSKLLEFIPQVTSDILTPMLKVELETNSEWLH